MNEPLEPEQKNLEKLTHEVKRVEETLAESSATGTRLEQTIAELREVCRVAARAVAHVAALPETPAESKVTLVQVGKRLNAAAEAE